MERRGPTDNNGYQGRVCERLREEGTPVLTCLPCDAVGGGQPRFESPIERGSLFNLSGLAASKRIYVSICFCCWIEERASAEGRPGKLVDAPHRHDSPFFRLL